MAPEFRQIDFDRDSEWERQLEAFSPDVVFALSVLHWFADKARFLAFLGRFDEVIFEGHESSRIERERLREAGFPQSIWSKPASAAGRCCWRANAREGKLGQNEIARARPVRG